MNDRRWSIGNYAASIFVLLAIMFLKDIMAVLATGFCFAAVLISQLLLLYKEEKWDGTHYIGLAYLLLALFFMILFVAIDKTGVTYLYGAVLILGAMTLIVLELISGWKTYKLLDKMASNGDTPAEERILEEVQPLQEDTTRYFAKQGSTTYHQEDCRTLQQTKVADLIQISHDEATAYNMFPCKICKP